MLLTVKGCDDSLQMARITFPTAQRIWGREAEEMLGEIIVISQTISQAPELKTQGTGILLRDISGLLYRSPGLHQHQDCRRKGGAHLTTLTSSIWSIYLDNPQWHLTFTELQLPIRYNSKQVELYMTYSLHQMLSVFHLTWLATLFPKGKESFLDKILLLWFVHRCPPKASCGYVLPAFHR